MALIGKIREKSALLVIIIGLALVAFIMGNWQKASGASEDEYGFGTVYGEKVEIRDYQENYEKFRMNDMQQFQQQGREYTQKDDEASADKAWNYTTETILFDKEYDALGINVGDDEFYAYIYGTDGFTVLPDLAQGFTDSLTGQFNPKLLEKRIQEMESSPNDTIQKNWQDYKKYLTDRRKQEKYFALVGQGLYVSKLEAEDEYFAQKEIKNISYVVRRYSEIEDNEIKISDEELKNYYEEHKGDKKYANREASREVRYFDMSIVPSKADTLAFNREMNKLKVEFQQTTNDSVFVIEHSETHFYNSSKLATAVPENNEKAQKMQSYPMQLDTVFGSAHIGQIVGPYASKGSMVISKVIGFTPRRLKARHILLSTNQSTDEKVIAQKQKEADSLLKFINKENFAEYVTKYSDDKGSVANGGVYDNFLEADMVPEFSTFCATKPVGTIGTVKTTYGIHIIEVMERDAQTFPVLASIYKKFEPSTETVDREKDKIYTILNKLQSKIGAEEDPIKKVAFFDTLAIQNGYIARPVNINENSPKLYGFTTKLAEDKILKLAFDDEAKVGDLVNAPIKDKDRYVIAILASIREKGEPTFQDAQVIMKRDMIEDIKAKRLTNSMLKDKSLTAMAKRANTEVVKAEVTFANPQITNAGFEPEVVGTLFSGIKPGQQTLPIKGKMGVYVIRLDKTVKAPAAANYDTERDQLLASQKGNLQGQVLNALKVKADVIDNRRFYELGIRR